MLVPAEDGHWVNEKFARIAEIIQDFDHHLQLVWIPPEHRTAFDVNPYGILRTGDDGKQDMIMYIKEEELDERVIANLFLNDTTKHDVLARIEASERAHKVLQMKAEMEAAEERQDFIKSVVNSGKHYYKHNGRVIPT